MTRRKTCRGFTLAEIMVAMTIFLMIGGMLLMALRSGVDTWSRTEAQRQVHEDAQALMALLRDDLSSLVSTGGGEGDPRVALLCDYDQNRRQRIRFIRTIPHENVKTELRLAGAGPPEEGYTEYLTEKGDHAKKLRPLGGLMEVVYCFDPDADPGKPESWVLYRGVRAPIGGKGSFFLDENLDKGAKVKEAASPVATTVLHLGFAFWSQYTTTWDRRTPVSAGLGGACGPVFTWDSTRAVLPRKPSKKGDPNRFFLAANAASRAVTADDVFPRQVQLTIVTRTRADHSMSAELLEDLGKGDKSIALDSSTGFPDESDPNLFRYVKIGSEWIHYKTRSQDVLEVDSRGARSTALSTHKAGDRVYFGRTFIVTVGIPAYREYWFGDNPAPKKEKP